MKQNKNTFVFRFLSSLTAFVVLVLSICCPAFAYSSVSLNGLDFTDQPCVYIPSTKDDYVNMLYCYEMYNSGYGKYGPCYVSSSKDAYVFIVVPSYGNSVAYIVSFESDCVYYTAETVNSNNTIGVLSSARSMSPVNGNPGVYYGNMPTIHAQNTNYNVPTFSSMADGIAAVRDWVDNPPPVAASPAVAQFVLPAGNAVVIDLGAWDNSNSDKKIQLSQTTQYVHPQQWSTNQFYAYTDSIPSSITTPFSGQNAINWYGNGKTNLFNQTNSFVANFIYNSSLGRYLVIINPFVPEDHDTDNYNSPISVYVGQCSGYKFYQLKTDVSQIGAFGGESDGTTGTGVYDPDSGTWSVTNDQTGDPWAPTQGGGNSNNVVSTVSGWLEQISHQISDFFSGAIGAVTNLVSAGSDFIHSLSGLYAWLPGPVYSVLVSALILVITIGVIKVFI